MAAEKRSKEARREQIAEAALEVIARHGTRSLSVGAVARRIGIVPSAIYRHFRGKEEILSAAIGRMGERLLENAGRAAAGEGGTIPRLRNLLRDHVRAIREGYAGPRIVFAEGIDGGGVSHRMEVYHVIRRYLDRVAGILRQGQRAGDLRGDLDPEATAVHFLGLIQPAATLWYLSAGKFDVLMNAERSFEQFADAIRKKGKRRRVP
ncbi:MAG TPA: TetR/AcrR family transcriptional regulator [Candidatus Deferrimicrobium sp.]|nr:TetR/AcrR family transcriptional regulator [Candidatus Deferrimicrobium sp.]